MTQRRIVFFSIFGTYQLLILIFTLFVDGQQKNISFLFGLFDKIYIFKYGAILGVILIAVDFIWSWRDIKSAAKHEEAMRLENNTLKAKVYDFTESEKTKASQIQSSK